MSESFEGPAIVDLMGRQRYTGRVSEAKVAGVSMVRIDTVTSEGEIEPKFFGAGAIYCITPITAEKLQAEIDGHLAVVKQTQMVVAVRDAWRKRPDNADAASYGWLGELAETFVDQDATKVARDEYGGDPLLVLVDGTELYFDGHNWDVNPF